jgi:pimeloyl-ACP methyl ester carboxylesterase
VAEKRSRAKRAGLITGGIALGVGAAVAAGVAAERAFIRREQRRPDPYRDEPYGTLHGRSIGPVASSDGTLIHVEEIGSGPTVVLSHGYTLNSTLWHHQIKELSGSMRLVMYDHRGHGHSGLPPSEDWSLDALARDMEAVIRDSAGDEPVVLVGHSMGGMTLLRFCELYPDAIGSRVRGLVLVSTSSADVIGGIVPPARRVETAIQGVQEAVLRVLAGRADHVDTFRSLSGNFSYLMTRLMGFGKNPSQHQVAFVEELIQHAPSHVWFSLLPSIVGLDVRAGLPTITVPTLVIAGDRDRLTPLSSAKAIVAEIPGAQLEIFPNTGHTPMIERHERFNKLLTEFVARVGARR